MRLCVLVAEYPSTTQTFVYEPVEWLRARGHRVKVVTERRGNLPGSTDARFPMTVAPRRELDRPVKLRCLLAAPFEAARHYGSAVTWSRAAVWSSWDVLARSLLRGLRDADYVLAHFGPHGLRWLPAEPTAGRPYAVFIHGFDASSWVQKHPGGYQPLLEAGAGFLTNGEYIKSRLLEAGVPANRIAICRLGASTDLASVTARPDLSARRILTIARLVAKKGIGDSITAFAQAQDTLQGRWRYEIVGDGSLRPELEELANGLGVSGLVRFRGFLSRGETIQALLEASLFVLASRTAPNGDTEGTPVSIIEAATLGLPVVSTIHAGIPEILPADAARAGLLVNEGDIGGLAEALRRLADSSGERQRWGDACREHARSHYSAASHVTGLIEGLAKVAQPPTWHPSVDLGVDHDGR